MPTTNLNLKNDFAALDLLPEAWLNSTADAVDEALRAGFLSTSVAGGAGDTTLTLAQYDATSLEATGALTGNRGIILPLTAGRWWSYKNSTSGAFTLTVKGASGAGVVVPQGATMLLLCDGTNFLAALATGKTYAASNVTTDRTYDANATTTDELADVLGSLIADLRAVGLVV